MTKTKFNPWADVDQLRADKIWLQEQLDVVKRENEMLRRVVDAAVADAIVENARERLALAVDDAERKRNRDYWNSQNMLFSASVETARVLADAVTEYRRLTEPDPLLSRPSAQLALSITSAAEDGSLYGVVERVREIALTGESR